MILQTERLDLEELSIEDTSFIYDLMNSEGYLKHIGDRGIKNLDDAKTYLSDRLMASYKTNGYGLYKVTLRATNEPIGLCGLVNRPSLSFPDIGFAFLPKFYGKGYGVESASATLVYSRQVLKLPKVVAITSSDNTASQKLLERIGLKFDSIVQIPEYDGDNFYYT